MVCIQGDCIVVVVVAEHCERALARISMEVVLRS